MAFSRLVSQDNKNTSATASVSVSYPGATTANNLLIATVYNNNSSTPAIAGWTAATAGINSNTAFMGIFYKLADGTETSISATATSATIMGIHVYEYSGNANPITLDVAFTSNATTVGSTSWATPSITTTLTGDLIFALAGLNGPATSPGVTNLNLRQTDSELFDADLIPGIIETSFSGTFSWTGTLKVSAIIGAFTASTVVTPHVKLNNAGLRPHAFSPGLAR